MRELDRTGIFKAVPLQWNVRTFDKSDAISINIEFQILAQLDDNNNWTSWEGYEDTSCWGSYFITRKDGSVNHTGVRQLAESLNWDGDMEIVLKDPPKVVVQITVKEDEYKGEIRYKAGWMNPGDYEPNFGLGEDELTSLAKRLGPQLRASAADAKGGKVPF